MKKYLNKGLLYAWFNSAKAPIVIGIFIFGFIANAIIKQNLWMVSNEISNNFSNYFYTTEIYNYYMLGVIFIAIYFIAKGINKRNTEMFLSSGPYTKKQIRYNEFICLLITLVLFVLTYVYIALMSYVSNAELISIIEGYANITIIEIIKIVLLGIIGIIFMLIIDSMFSNSVIGFICMISVIPVSIFMVFMKIYKILEYSGVWYNQYLFNGIQEYDSNNVFKRYVGNIMLERVSFKDITIKGLSKEVIITLIIILIMIFIYNVVQRKVKLETYNKLFSSKNNESIVVILVSAAFGSFGSLFFVEDYISGAQFKSGQSLIINGLDLLKVLSVDVICVAVIGFISYVIIRKILKNII